MSSHSFVRVYNSHIIQDAVWQLLGLACWTIEFVERLFKECVFIGDRSDPGPTTPKENGSTPLTNSGLDNPIFLHLVHPFALAQLHSAAEHVKRFSDQLSRLPAKGDSARIAKDVLMDATEGSGVDLALLGPLLAEVLQDCKKLDGELPPSHLELVSATCVCSD